MNTIEKITAASRKVPLLGWFAVGSLLLGGMLLLAAGVTSGTTATGMVRLDGQPLPTGWIRFVPLAETPGPDAGAAIVEGKYRVVKGLEVGEYRVEIDGTRKSPKKVRDPFGFGTRLVQDEVPAVAPEFNQNSKLMRMINRGSNTLDFDVEGAKGKRVRPSK